MTPLQSKLVDLLGPMQLTDDQLANSCGPLLGALQLSFVADTLDVKMLNITGVELMMFVERATPATFTGTPEHLIASLMHISPLSASKCTLTD
jgi:hypothetical protein